MRTHPLQPPQWIATAPILNEATVFIAAPPERVWKLIADNEGWPRWYRELTKVETTRAPAGVGGGRRATAGKVVLEETFTAWKAPSHWALSIVGSTIPILAAGGGEVLIKPSQGGCQVTYRQAMQGRPGFGWLLRLANRQGQQKLQRTLGRLRDLAQAAS